MSTITQKNINKYIIGFLSEHGSDETVELWNEKNNQTKLASVLNKGTKKVSPKKDPACPKRGKSAYIFFCADQREAVKADLGDDVKPTEITAELGSRWNALKEDTDKKRVKQLAGYTKQAEDDKMRYTTEMESYVPSEGGGESESDEGDAKVVKRVKKVKDPNAIKKPLSSYLFFCAEQRETIKAEMPEGTKPKEIMTELGVKWNEIKTNKKFKKEFDKYTKMAADDKERYAQANSDKSETESDDSLMEKPKAKKTPKAAPVEAVEETEAAEEQVIVKKTSGKKTSGYICFCQETREELKNKFPDLKGGESTKKLAEMWKAMSNEDKQVWKDKAVA